MKAYRIEGKYSQAVFYVGYRKDVEETLASFFSKYKDGVKPSKRDPNHQEKQLASKISLTSSKVSHITEPRSQPSANSQGTKHLSLHILLYDLSLMEYNQFKSEMQQIFSQQISGYHDPMVVHFAIVESREESLKYIKKIEKYTHQQFESNLFQLNKELQQTAEYDLVKGYLGEKFNISREEVFGWMQTTGIRSFKELLGFKDVPSYQKKELRQLLNNLTLLQSLYQNQAQRVEQRQNQKEGQNEGGIK